MVPKDDVYSRPTRKSNLRTLKATGLYLTSNDGTADKCIHRFDEPLGLEAALGLDLLLEAGTNTV
jgi:hypothetical protein